MLIKEGKIKLSDLGASKSYQNNEARTFCGTPQTLAPEVLADENKIQGPYSDLFSIGVILFILLFDGRLPFPDEHLKKLEAIEKSHIKFEFTTEKDSIYKLTKEHIDLFKHLLNFSTEKRMTME